MPARIPLDVDLEDKLLYGLTPTRLAYLLVALVAAFGLWSSHWSPPVVRGGAAATLAATGAVAAWGRWRGRAIDMWAIDLAIFAAGNHTIEWRDGLRRRSPTPAPMDEVAAASSESLPKAA